jgi:hypothetical protein
VTLFALSRFTPSLHWPRACSAAAVRYSLDKTRPMMFDFEIVGELNEQCMRTQLDQQDAIPQALFLVTPGVGIFRRTLVLDELCRLCFGAWLIVNYTVPRGRER